MRAAECKSFFLCPSCGQKRTLLLGEYLADDLLLRLPHRQFVWTIPKALRGFLKRDRSLFAAVGKLIYSLIAEYYTEAAGRPLVTGMVSSHQTFGEFATFHPHWHTIVLEGGFDSHDRFFFMRLSPRAERTGLSCALARAAASRSVPTTRSRSSGGAA